MTVTSAQEAIATLLKLAERGEINPWDVQVIDIIDRFLTELGLPHDLEFAYQQANLPRSGQAFLWASRLVLFKAETLEQLQNAAEEAEESGEDELEAAASLFAWSGSLESHLKRRNAAPPQRRRRVTLQELIAEIEKIAAELEQVPVVSSPSVKPSRLPSRREVVRSITELAHQENLTETASQLEKFLQVDLPRLAPGRTKIDFAELLDWWGKEQPEGDYQRHNLVGERVGIFWALLLLSSQSKVELSQEEFYQDLTIQVL
jgi:segregation and condensation protein A